jgi:nicotinamide-nucleotide amidase
MKLEIICLGTELLRGTINTNVSHISEALLQIGLIPSWENSVGDIEEDIESVLVNSLERSDVLILTGGLGPTFDDITREVVAKVLNLELVYDKKLMKPIEDYCRSRKLEIIPNLKNMAYVIKNSIVIDNKYGTAVGLIINTKYKNKNRIVILLPGPPHELKPMLKDVMNYLRKNIETLFSETLVLQCFGLPEGKIESMMLKIVNKKEYKENKDIVFAILASNNAIVKVKATVSGKSNNMVNKIIKKIESELIGCIGDYVFAKGDETLESVVGDLFLKNKKTLSVAESCTGGFISNSITDVSGSSKYFLHGEIVYSNASKIRDLGVNPETIKKYGAVSSQTAKEMAIGIREKTGSSIGLSVTGILGPTGATKNKPIGLVFIGLDTGSRTKVYEKIFKGDRRTIKSRVATMALDILRICLKSQSSNR